VQVDIGRARDVADRTLEMRIASVGARGKLRACARPLKVSAVAA
jgi:hypothetical protein